VIALNGKEAIKKVMEDVRSNPLKISSFNLILMDCNMPMMDGFEATQQIREFMWRENLPQPIITAVTGQTE